jgi:MFS transporter, FSR family, fosmidomycin resistance protein
MSVETTVDAAPLRRDAKVLGLLGSGHFFSHFFGIALPPLFPLLQVDLAVSYAALGALLAAANIATLVCQVPVGILVDRLGARRLLAVGLSLMSGGIAGIALAPGYGVVVAMMVLVGIGNSVFHPADYAVMVARISPQRLGRAFSLHTFAGHLGWAVSPMMLAFLTVLWNWRVALAIAGLCGFLTAIMILARGRDLDIETSDRAATEPPVQVSAGKAESATGSVRALMSTPIILFFLYMVFAAVASSGLNGFAVTVLVDDRGVPLAAANFALTAMLVTSALGVLLGGLIADRTRRHDLVVVAGFCTAAGIAAMLGLVPVPLAALVAGLGAVGLAQGMIRPSRDMMVRAIAPPGSVGTVFGFVTAGLNVGSAASPIFFGWLIDNGFGSGVFVVAAGAMLLALGSALLASGLSRGRKAAQ